MVKQIVFCSISPAPSAMGLSVLQQPKHQVNLFSRNPIKSSQMSANLPLTIFLTNKSNLSQNFHNFSRVSQDFEIFDIGVVQQNVHPTFSDQERVHLGKYVSRDQQ